MPGTMVDIFGKGGLLGNVFNTMVSSADGVDFECAGEVVESDGTLKFVPFQEILGQQIPRHAPCSTYPPQKSGKPVEVQNVVELQKETFPPPLPTSDKLQVTKPQTGNEVIKGARPQEEAELNYLVTNEHILNDIFSAHLPDRPVAGFSSPTQIKRDAGELQMNNTITGNGANIAPPLFPYTAKTLDGIDGRTSDASFMVDNQVPVPAAGNKPFQGEPVKGLAFSEVASTTFVREVQVGIGVRQDKAVPMVDNQAPVPATGNKPFQGEPVKGLAFSEVASTTFVRESSVEIGVRQDKAFPMVDNQVSSATARNKDFQEWPIEKTGINLKGAVIEIPKGAERLQMMDTFGISSIQMLQLLRNGQPGLSVPSSSIEIQGSEFQGFYPEQGVVNPTTFKGAAQTAQVSPSLTANEQPAKGLLLHNITDSQQGKHIYKEDTASTAAFGLQHNGGQETFEGQPEETSVLDFASLETTAQKTPADLSVTVNTQPTKGSRLLNYLELQHNASISHGNNTTQPSSVEGGDVVMTYLRHGNTDTAGQAHANIMDQLFQKISLATHGDRSEIKLYLTPPELGKVKIHFVEENNDVEAKIFVENAEVKATIENNVHHLRESIASSGISIHKLEVYLQNEDTHKQKSLEDFSANNFGRQNQGQRHAGQGKGYFGEGEAGDSAANRESGVNASNFIIDYIS